MLAGNPFHINPFLKGISQAGTHINLTLNGSVVATDGKSFGLKMGSFSKNHVCVRTSGLDYQRVANLSLGSVVRAESYGSWQRVLRLETIAVASLRNRTRLKLTSAASQAQLSGISIRVHQCSSVVKDLGGGAKSAKTHMRWACAI